MSPNALRVLVVLALAATGCSVTDTSAENTSTTAPIDPGRVIVWNDDTIGILEDGDITEIDSAGSVSQVTPAGNGSLVWTSVRDEPPQALAVIEFGTRIEAEASTVPFFYGWNSAGDRVAFLGNAASGAGLVFGLIDAADGNVIPRPAASPFFFDWAPDGERLIAHVGGASLAIIDAGSGAVEDLENDSGDFPAPVWEDEGIVVVIRQGPTISGPVVEVGLQQSSGSVVLLDPDDGSSRELASIEGPARLFPGSEYLAIVAGVVGSQQIEVVDWTGTPIVTIGSGSIDLVQWSPDGSALLWTERREGGSLAPLTWEQDEVDEHDGFTPSAVFATAYLPFWDQYDRSISLWSPDSTSFLLPSRRSDVPVVSIRNIDGSRDDFEGWDMAVWASSEAGD